MTQDGLFDVPGGAVGATREPRAPKPIEDRPAAASALLRSMARPCEGCNRPIVFAWVTKTRAGKETTKLMPVDVDAEPGGNVHVVAEGRVLRAVVLGKARTLGRADLRLSHFATCDAPEQFRKRGRS